MSHNKRITENSSIIQYLMKLNFALYFTKPVIRHIVEFIIAATQKGYSGTVTDIVNLSLANCHRTTFGKFLSQGVWNIEYAWRAIRREVICIIFELSQTSNKPIFVIFDDTIAEKTKPSLQAKHTIQATGFHQSHLKGKQVWGHQLLTMMLSCGNVVLPYCIERYEKGGKSKIERICEMVSMLPIPKGPAYGLCDSWYINKKVIEAHFERGYHLIGALKTNRIIYPQGIRIQIKDFAQYIEKNEVHLVTVNGSNYWVYRYEGALNGIDNAVVVLCWPEKAFKNQNALHAFICTDTELDTETILNYYSQRWPIEIFFRQTKNNLGLNTYQVRSTKSIDRLLWLISLTYLYCTTSGDEYCKFGQGIKIVRKEVQKQRVQWLYERANNKVPIDEILEELQLA
ncbi:transposase IS4 family protein [Thermoanaerobacterium xylanolyticum LX-11]|uniref:Transposase IS4 family protein n=1 Tax=Thermoanaerobacterium xylanolyticum (strain ATCC 49914 / DSM 7097 / LX-11) TaxID=858215 RepID=F6BH46_THEXL|nr:IS701 family transposase [Thermoanaerobacterium xylanolyticum]AEF16490.1 transposase IS4 family protein [Thermoanaerobacterium xylanolyticum LX-11]